jgi:hypothetical protein
MQTIIRANTGHAPALIAPPYSSEKDLDCNSVERTFKVLEVVVGTELVATFGTTTFSSTGLVVVEVVAIEMMVELAILLVLLILLIS